jgi:regulatory protein
MKPVEPENETAARMSALQHLARRDHCSTELRTRLRKRGYAPSTIAAVISALEQEKVINEQRFVENFVIAQSGRGKGPDYIRRKLRVLGVKDSELVGQLVETGADWVAVARQVRRKRFGAAPSMASDEMQKQVRFLRQRGFTVSQLREALTESSGS